MRCTISLSQSDANKFDCEAFDEEFFETIKELGASHACLDGTGLSFDADPSDVKRLHDVIFCLLFPPQFKGEGLRVDTVAKMIDALKLLPKDMKLDDVYKIQYYDPEHVSISSRL